MAPPNDSIDRQQLRGAPLGRFSPPQLAAEAVRAPMSPEVATLFSLLMRQMDRLRDTPSPLRTERRGAAALEHIVHAGVRTPTSPAVPE
jgi:hypothetical protein